MLPHFIFTRLTRPRVVVGALLVLFASTGCRPDLVSPTASVASTEAARISAGTSSDASHFSAAFARALRSASVRAELHRELRRSPYTLHKVHLQRFLHDDNGRKLLGALGDELNLSPDEVLADLDALPALELSLPRRRDRLQWRVSEKLAVVAKFDNATRVVTGFATSGETITFPSTAPAAAVLAIRPSRGFTLRSQQQPDRPSAVVQDADDGEYGARQVIHKANGDSVEVQLVTKSRALNDPGRIEAMTVEEIIGDGGGGSVPPSYGPATKIGMFELLNAHDFGQLGNSNEFRFETWLVQPNGNVLEHITTHADGLFGDNAYILDLRISSGSPGQFNGNYIALVIYEEDGWSGRDDFFNGNIGYAERGPWGYQPRMSGGADRCGYSNNQGYHACPIPYSDGVTFFWREVNFNVFW